MTMNLYSAVHFRSIGSSVHHDTPRLIADDGTIQSVGNLQWANHRAEFESLREGMASVVPVSIEDSKHSINKGWRVTRLPDYKQGRVVFDEHAKEFVMLSNGNCVCDHSTPERYQLSHRITDQGHGVCQYAPSEAIALRAFIDNGKAVIAWTYRKVNPCDLKPVTDEQRTKQAIQAVMSHRRSARFIGRI